MNLGHVRKIVDAVLYEGYVLYPYRATSAKNRQRWTFGGIYPAAWFDETGGADPCHQQCQVLLTGDLDTRLEVRVRFLQPLAREVGELDEPLEAWHADPDLRYSSVPLLEIGEQRYHAWQEAVERELVVADAALGDLFDGVRQPFSFAGRDELEPVSDEAGLVRGVLHRWQPPLQGLLMLMLEQVSEEACRLTIRIENLADVDVANLQNREQASLYSFASTHTVLGVAGGEFVSLLDPQDSLAEVADACEQDGAWPVLIGPPGSRDTLLCSPIILYDYPEVAPESPGDLFDATEIDEILSLNILAMTDEEKRDMMATDPRAAAMLERTEGLTGEDFMRLHGVLREPHREDRHRRVPPPPPRLASYRRGGLALEVGDRVRLKPNPGGDVWDIALAGKTAVIESIERDFEDRVHVAVAIDDDPGREWAFDRMPGHRFFFSPEEIERVEAARPAEVNP